MKLSNTLMMNEALLPSNKKAFTLAEVLITLSILGVVAALTIPTLINRQSDLAAQTKLKKAITNYENVAGSYMAETGETTAAGLVGDANCGNLGNYFKIVTDNGCTITTPDGVVWYFKAGGNGEDGNPALGAGNVIVADAASNPRYAVVMWTKEGVVNGTNTVAGAGGANVNQLPAGQNELPAALATAPVHNYFNSSFAQYKSNDGPGYPTAVAAAAGAPDMLPAGE